MTEQEFDTLVYKLGKRGFKRDDLYFHECPACAKQSVVIFAIAGRSGGRDIRVCHECGDARSSRTGAGMDGRIDDPGFDLATFLR